MAMTEDEVVEKVVDELARLFRNGMMEGACKYCDTHGLNPEEHAEEIAAALRKHAHRADRAKEQLGDEFFDVPLRDWECLGEIVGFEAAAELFGK